MDELNEDMIKACLDLMMYCSTKDSNGFDAEIITPIGSAHCKFDFTIDLNEENE